MHNHKHGMMHKQVWCMSDLMRHGMAKCNKQYYKLSGGQYATSCILAKHHMVIFSWISFTYTTILNVFKHGKRWSIMKTNYLDKFKWGRNNKQQFLENPHVHISKLVLFCPKTYFNVVKQQNKVHRVKLGIFYPIYI